MLVGFSGGAAFAGGLALHGPGRHGISAAVLGELQDWLRDLSATSGGAS